LSLPTPFDGLDNFSRATLFVESNKEKTMDDLLQTVVNAEQSRRLWPVVGFSAT
jgi:hypothetical protein